jgi:hypothetical protein
VEAVAVAEGLWRWTALDPDAGEVGCVYYEAADATVLFDPLLPAGEEERFLRYLDADVERRARPVVILLTAESQRRSADELADRYDARIGGALPDGVEEVPVEGADEHEVAYLIGPHSALVVSDARSAAHLKLPVERLLVSRG